MILFYSRYKCLISPDEALEKIRKSIISSWAAAAAIHTGLPEPQFLGLEYSERFKGHGFATTPIPQRPRYAITDTTNRHRMLYGNLDWLNGYEVFFVDLSGNRVQDIFATRLRLVPA